ncbi:MAG: 3-keto-5-aminohexanoate cleavage protein [Rhizobiaceae bacterium]
MSDLPQIMVAPNGARRTRQDHPALPITIEQTVETAKACFVAGAGGIHAHVRDGQGSHTLDSGLYRELLAELNRAVPQMLVQITTEAVGVYSSDQQMKLVSDLQPAHVSIAMREITQGQSEAELSRFFNWAAEAGIQVQHILYAPEEIQKFARLVEAGIIPVERLETILVLGQYGIARDSQPDDLSAYRHEFKGALSGSGWCVCAFGRNETACLMRAIKEGGKARIGFENNLIDADGSLSPSNEARVRELVAALAADGVPGSSSAP